MNHQSAKWVLLPIISILLLLNACKKQDLPAVENGPQTQSENQTLKSFGALPEDPSKLKTIPAIVSANYMDYMAARITGSGKGKGSGTGTGGTTTSDITPPSVAITSPADGSSVSGAVTINVSASDNIGVTSVSASVDGSIISTATASPYTFSWNADAAASGAHTISVKALDAAGNWSTSSISVTKNATVVTPPPSLPSSFSLITPPVGYQGGESSCAAFAVAYAARSIDYYYKSGSTGYSFSNNVFSPEYAYNQTKFSDCGSGTGITTVLDLLKAKGVCTWQSMPYSYSNGCDLMPDATQFAEASNYKIASYSWLYCSDMAALKNQLINGHAVIIGVLPDQAFVNAGPGFIWSSYTSGKTAGHIIIICGYDDAKKAYKVMNSWGTSWGDGGYSWIDYDFLPYTGSGVAYVIN